MISKIDIQAFFENLQNDICLGLEKADTLGKFECDPWTRAEGGGGKTNVMKKGKIIEKGGVAFSAVHGPVNASMAKQLQIDPAESFFASGVSLVIHPENPHCPIIHMNVRYFEISNGTWWFGGGIDLTPIYVNTAQAKAFHEELQAVCEEFSPNAYLKYKTMADDYFYLSHRNETRGVGGIFVEHLGIDGGHKDEIFQFIKNIGNTFLKAYVPIITANHSIPYGEAEKEWQLKRRSRYVEFNLLLDRGTKFGFESGGRTESILLSMPPLASWEYNYQPKEGTKEAETQGLLRKDVDWLKM